MSDEELLISKYPYLGYSQNLIECFSIIGYDENILTQIIEEYKNNNNNNLYSPSILSSIISDKDYSIIDNDLLIKQIFPSNPNFITNVKNNNNKRGSIIKENKQIKKVIYSFIIDSQDGKKKKLYYTCFGYIFYEKYESYDSNNSLFSLEEYSIPKAFCIVSQYSFFSFFNYICSNIHNLLNKDFQKIPLEILIYNIVNFIPAPLNYSINYNIFNNELDIPPYFLPQLSGYPYLDFDLIEIFCILPLNLIIEIFLLTLLEQSILFFSSDLEILNMVMFIMYSLNYPCNNSTYFWHIVSIPTTNFNEENRFVSQIMTSLLGVNSSYDDSINTFAFGDYHYIVDIDNKKIFFKEKNNINIDFEEDIDKIIKIRSYLQSIIKEKNVESSFLKNFIDELKKDLDNILIKEDLGNLKSKKEINFFTGEKKYNKLIQECFYNFILNILMIFYQNTNLTITYDKIKIELFKNPKSFKINIKDENSNPPSEEEQIFCELFKASSKYKIYFENFIQNCESHQLYKIPLIFSEEFINSKIKSRQNKEQLNLSFFNIIDNLYNSSSDSNPLNISITNINYLYTEDKLKLYFSEHNIQSKENNNELKLFTFNKNIIQKYIYLLNNRYEKNQIKKMFPSLIIKNEEIHFFDRKIITQTIQNAFEKNNLIKTSNYLIYALIYIFSILMSLYSYKNLLYYFDKLLGCIKKLDYFFRFYIYIIIQTFYKYYLINKKNNNYPEMKYNNIKIYFYLFLTHLKDEKILPNEEIFLIQKNFFVKNIVGRERSSFKEKNNIIEMELVDYVHQDIELNLKDKCTFQIFMKYNFCYKGIYKPKIVIKTAMKETGYYNIAIKDEFNKNGNNNDKKKKTPVIVTKVMDDIYKSELYSPKKIFKLSQNAYKDFINNAKLDLEKINIKYLREILVNLIQYSIELQELQIPYDFLVNGLYLTRNLNENFILNNKASIHKNKTIK